MDVLAAQTVINYMKTARAEGKLVVLSTHDMTHAQELCNRVAIMHRGKIVAMDKQDVIFQKTQTQNLEEAFLKIIGEDEISAANQEREAQFLKKSDKPKRKFGL